MSDSDVTGFVDYYKLFDVEPSAPLQAIRSSYVRLAKSIHPDVGGSTEAMQKLNQAYRTLANSSARAAYDMMHKLHTGQTGQEYQYVVAPSGNGHTGNDDYIDMFIDQVYREFSGEVTSRRRNFLSKFFSR